HHYRPPPQRAALCLAAEHHEGEEEADRSARTRCAGRRSGAASGDAESRRAVEAQIRRQGEGRRRPDRQDEERSEGDLMSVLVIADHDNASVRPATLNTVAAATKLGDVTVLVAGTGCKTAADAAAKIAGVKKVLLADSAGFGHGLAENVAP